MASRALNDDEALNEMTKMVAFIRQEGMEKAREVRAKADEEFTIEKAKLVKQEMQAIDQQFEKRQKQAQLSQKIAQSTQLNKARLRILQRREEHIQDLFTSAREKLLELSKDEGRYVQLIEGIIVQGLLQLMEAEVKVISRAKDTKLVERAADSAKRQYAEISGRDVSIFIEGGLPDSLAGGVKVISGNGRISLDNTLDERLKLLESRMLPEIRHDLFGPNENRKFFN